jgi:rubrerythrin
MKEHCVHSCKGLCAALSAAEHREEVALDEYRIFMETCEYPDVRTLLESLVKDKMIALRKLKEVRALLSARFETLDQVNDAFA